MPKSVSPLEVEDVLSSIRRLVSDDTRAPAALTQSGAGAARYNAAEVPETAAAPAAISAPAAVGDQAGTGRHAAEDSDGTETTLEAALNGTTSALKDGVPEEADVSGVSGIPDGPAAEQADDRLILTAALRVVEDAPTESAGDNTARAVRDAQKTRDIDAEIDAEIAAALKARRAARRAAREAQADPPPVAAAPPASAPPPAPEPPAGQSPDGDDTDAAIRQFMMATQADGSAVVEGGAEARRTYSAGAARRGRSEAKDGGDAHANAAPAEGRRLHLSEADSQTAPEESTPEASGAPAQSAASEVPRPDRDESAGTMAPPEDESAATMAPLEDEDAATMALPEEEVGATTPPDNEEEGAASRALRNRGEADMAEAARVMQDASVLDDSEDILDEETLRELVSETVREELMGELGERITRNVKKLVRREIQRSLAGREFE